MLPVPLLVIVIKLCSTSIISQCWQSPRQQPAKAWPRAASQSEPRSSIPKGKLIGSGHNRRVQSGDPSLHGETMPSAMRGVNAVIANSSWSPRSLLAGIAADWCDSLVSQLIVGESRNFQGGVEWPWLARHRRCSISISSECASLLREYIRENPEIWNEDIGEE